MSTEFRLIFTASGTVGQGTSPDPVPEQSDENQPDEGDLP